ncbi:hypothetical protein CEXT_656701 [Caerostris extrusa]|uniref:Uncharacterized protein n=1 Tax=Caerostris extrusa TaxID=172846 RepID=A0AAV4XDC4_CAEEX|nr:hypothetical protein CEXT_656701 [Caerostris extrusa]
MRTIPMSASWRRESRKFKVIARATFIRKMGQMAKRVTQKARRNSVGAEKVGSSKSSLCNFHSKDGSNGERVTQKARRNSIGAEKVGSSKSSLVQLFIRKVCVSYEIQLAYQTLRNEIHKMVYNNLRKT